jgi:hypothetical protein
VKKEVVSHSTCPILPSLLLLLLLLLLLPRAQLPARSSSKKEHQVEKIVYQDVIKEVEKEVVRYEADPTINTKLEDLQREKEDLNGTVLELRKQVCMFVCVHVTHTRARARARALALFLTRTHARTHAHTHTHVMGLIKS